MKYIEKTLMNDEEPILYTRKHWILFFPALIWVVIGILLLMFGEKWLAGLGGIVLFTLPLHVILSWIAFFIAIIHALSSYLSYISSVYAITNHRILMKEGFFHSKSMEIFLNKIESVQLSQKIFGKILCYGTITIASVSGSKAIFHHVPRPQEFIKLAQEQISKLGRQQHDFE